MIAMEKLKQTIATLSTQRQAHGLDDVDLETLHHSFRAMAELASKHNLAREECEALANLCLLLADKNPNEVISLADRFFALHLMSNEWLQMHVEDALAVAYNHLLDEISARQHRARAIELRKKLHYEPDAESTVMFWTLHAAFKYADTTIPPDEKYVVKLSAGQDVAGWLAAKSQISISDVLPSLGGFVTNDRQFYGEAMDRVRMLSDRLKNNLSKPDNYLLIADPGAGKSFFVKQFKQELENTYGQPIEFLERNMSAYNSVEQAFADIVIDVMIALMTRRATLLFIDEVDTQLDDKNVFQRLIAPMNGDLFFFAQKTTLLCEAKPDHILCPEQQGRRRTRCAKMAGFFVTNTKSAPYNTA